MTSIQYIERDGKREYAVVPIELFERLLDAAEDLEDAAALETFRRSDDGVRIPGEVVRAILDDVHPVRAWREYRELTQDALAKRAGISKAYLCQIENRRREGSVRTLAALAEVLGTSLDDIRT